MAKRTAAVSRHGQQREQIEVQKSKPCQYFTLGCCKYDNGDDCAFSHNRSVCVPGYYNVPCSHFMKSFCRNGKFCLYKHCALSREESRNSKGKSRSQRKEGPLKYRLTENGARRLKLSDNLVKHVDKSDDNELSQAAYNLRLSELDSTYYYGGITPPDGRVTSDSSKKTSAATWRSFATRLPREPSENSIPVGSGKAVASTQPAACQFYIAGTCKFGTECKYTHGQNILETQAPLAVVPGQERNPMLECSICLEVVCTKSDPRFGVLPACEHVFCLGCIRSWRSSGVSDKQKEEGLARSCPTCREISNFVVPSAFFPSTKEEKTGLLSRYRQKLGSQDCKYYKRGAGSCPFGGSCFYLHRDSLGNVQTVGSIRTLKDDSGHTVHATTSRISDYVPKR